MSRRKARELALRILYWHEQSGDDLTDIAERVLDAGRYSAEDRKFSQHLVMKTVECQAPIDRAIVKVLKNWQYERVALIDKLILRMGACEILYNDDVPFEVAINEAIEISKKYGDEDSPKFVNGILDTITGMTRRQKHDESGDNKRHPL